EDVADGLGELVGVTDPLVEVRLLEALRDTNREAAGVAKDQRRRLSFALNAAVERFEAPRGGDRAETLRFIDAAFGERPLDGGRRGLDGGRSVADEVEGSHQTGTA